MSAAFKFSSRLREIRIHLCQKSLSSNGARDFINEHYLALKQTNPKCPILIRECEGIQPKLWARFENGKENVISLSNKNSKEILKQLESMERPVCFSATVVNMEPKYHFTHLKSKSFNVLTNKTALDYLMKWSIKGQLKLVTFGFNESLQSYQINDLVEDFFRNEAVRYTLNQLLPAWSHTSDELEKIKSEVVPCTISSLSFFDRILNENNNIVRAEGSIQRCLDYVVDEFIISNELQKILIDEESDKYGLFNENDRRELIFRIFRFLVLGGQWCQYEDKINPYFDLTKILYKDLLRVEKNPVTKKIEIKSICLRVKLIGKKKTAIFPKDDDHLQNFAYLIIDPTFRQLTLFVHEYGGQF